MSARAFRVSRAPFSFCNWLISALCRFCSSLLCLSALNSCVHTLPLSHCAVHYATERRFAAPHSAHPLGLAAGYTAGPQHLLLSNRWAAPAPGLPCWHQKKKHPDTAPADTQRKGNGCADSPDTAASAQRHCSRRVLLMCTGQMTGQGCDRTSLT